MTNQELLEQLKQHLLDDLAPKDDVNELFGEIRALKRQLEKLQDTVEQTYDLVEELSVTSLGPPDSEEGRHEDRSA